MLQNCESFSNKIFVAYKLPAARSPIGVITIKRYREHDERSHKLLYDRYNCRVHLTIINYCLHVLLAILAKVMKVPITPVKCHSLGV